MALVALPSQNRIQPRQSATIERKELGRWLGGAWLASVDNPLQNAANPSKRMTAANAPTFPINEALGRHVLVNGSSQYIRETSVVGMGALPLTFFVKFRPDALNAGNHTIMALTASGGTSVILQLYTANSVLFARHYNSSTTVDTTGLVVGTTYSAAVVYRSTTSRELWLNGVLVDTDTATGPSVAAINQMDIGASPWAGPGEYFQGAIGSPMVFNRALTEAEIRSLHSNPYQVFVAPSRDYWLNTLTAGTVISPGVGEMAITGHAPAIQQTSNQIISPSIGELAITGHAPTIVQSANQVVIPATAALQVTGYAPTIVQVAGSQTIAVGVKALEITGHAPAIVQASNAQFSGGYFADIPQVQRKKTAKQEREELGITFQAKQLIEKVAEQAAIMEATDTQAIGLLKSALDEASVPAVQQYAEAMNDKPTNMLRRDIIRSLLAKKRVEEMRREAYRRQQESEDEEFSVELLLL